MEPYLNDFVRVLSRQAQKRVAFVLDEAKIDKEQLQGLADKLSKRNTFNSLVVPTVSPLTIISGDRFSSAVRSANLSISDVYDVSNDVTLLLRSLSDIMFSEIKALEDEIDVLEKSIDNYAFLLADGGAFDYAFLEPFSNELGRDTLPFLVPDRQKQFFSQGQSATIEATEGILCLKANQATTFPIASATVVGNNASALITSDTGVENMINSRVDTGWRMAVSSPAVVKASLPGFTEVFGSNNGGVQVVVELGLSNPAPCDSIVITGFAESPFDIAQIFIYADDTTETTTSILDSPITVTGTRNIYFTLQPVSKIRMLIRQETYNRVVDSPIWSELDYRLITPIRPVLGFPKLPTTPRITPRSIGWFMDIVDNQKLGTPYSLSVPNTNYDAPFGALTKDSSSLDGRSGEYRSDRWDNNTQAGKVINDVLLKTLGTVDVVDALNHTGFTTKQPGEDTRSDTGSKDATANMDPIRPQGKIGTGVQRRMPLMSYTYLLGIKTVSVGTSIDKNKAVFVSKQIPAPGDIGELKLKVSDTNILSPRLDLDNRVLTSVEYSVTNQAQPKAETDWFPIMPVDADHVVSERFYPDDTGKGFFRFPASLQGDLVFYKNGMRIDTPLEDAFIRAANQQSILGLRFIPTQISSNDILTVDYVPLQDYTIVNFEDANFLDAPLVSAYDDNGAGEGFDTSGGQYTVSLRHKPYIDYAQVDVSTYNAATGLSPYTPVVVRFNDGTTFTNLTNYQGAEQSALDPDADGYQFTHNNDVLMFNQVVNQPFKVYYQYLPNNIRVRVVLRCNDSTVISPKVDYFQVKAKTRKADAKNS